MATTAGLAPRTFALRFAAYSLVLFGGFRLGWMELHLIGPLADAQGTLAAAIFGPPAAPMITTLACSGADALALCLAAVLAYPTAWRRRIAGAITGLALILSVNVIRIGTLGLAAGSEWFNLLHLYIWPMALTLVIGAFLVVWTHRVDRPTQVRGRFAPASWLPAPGPARVFVSLTALLMLIFILTSPLYLESRAVLDLATVMAAVAASALGSVGITASHSGNVLITDRGALLVTQECITTPLIPVYLAAVTAFVASWRMRVIGYVAVLPIFVALGIARLLVVALPAALVGSPLFLIHAFYQLALGVVVVFVLALWRHGRRDGAGHAAVGLAIGAAFLWIAGGTYSRTIAAIAGMPADDPQGAIQFLPGFQIALYLALWGAVFAAARWTRMAAGLAALVLTQTALLFTLHALAQSGIAANVRDVRAWAVVGPLLIFLLMQQTGGSTGSERRAASTR